MSKIKLFELWLSEIIIKEFSKFSKSSLLKVNCSVVILLSVSSFMHTSTGSLCFQHFKKCHLLKSFYEAADILSSLMCNMIFLFCWLLYGDRFKCLGGTPIHPHVQHSPMASSPFPVPRKKYVIVNPDPTLIHIHSPSGSQTHAWTINSCTAINLAQRKEKIESPRFRQKRNG